MEDNFDDDFNGGMYNLLKLIDKLLFKSPVKEISKQELLIFCKNVSSDSITKNLGRLKKAGFLEMEVTRDSKNCNCKKVKYKLKGDPNEIRKCLYN
jgi:DNA-binding PadR family transcriptional regulator